MKKLENLRPERVFHYFEEICSIPHGSGNTDKISEYCVEFAKKHNLSYIREDIGNVIIKKPATFGKENRPGVIIQGHLDMVCEKVQDIDFDFFNDSLNIDTDGEYVFAHSTTLGADDGVAVAIALALLEADDIAHPSLEVILTVDEETGLYGANALDGSLIRSRQLINIDSEEEGIFTVSCAGGVRTELILPVEYETNVDNCLKITVDGLMGGHSGVEIHKGRLNSNKVAAAFLNTLDNYRLVSINGGLKDNAIPVFTEIVIASNENILAKAEQFKSLTVIDTDPALSITVEDCPLSEKCFTSKSTKEAVELLNSLPNGIIKWSDNIDGLVETSLNLGTLKTDSQKVSAAFAVRSSVDKQKNNLVGELKTIADKYSCEFKEEGQYPAWEYNKDSFLRDTMISVYKDMYGKAPQVVAIHAGLECGVLSEKLPGLDAVSIGPDIKDIHTPRERLSVSSTERVYNYLVKLLETL